MDPNNLTGEEMLMIRVIFDFCHRFGKERIREILTILINDDSFWDFAVQIAMDSVKRDKN